MPKRDNKRQNTEQQKGTQIAEKGNIYFFYRPKVNEMGVRGLEDVQRFYMILHPYEQDIYRLIVVGKKRLPDAQSESSHAHPLWAFVEMVAQDPKAIRAELMPETYETETRGQQQELAARPAGEGVYAIARHERGTHLVYALELPKQPDEVQQTFNIEQEASYVLTIKNPDAPNPTQLGLPQEEQAKYPRELLEMFRGRRFIPLDPPDFLNHQGAEILLITAVDDISSELGIELSPEDETEATADILKDLKLDTANFPRQPLFEGKWTGGDQRK